MDSKDVGSNPPCFQWLCLPALSHSLGSYLQETKPNNLTSINTDSKQRKHHTHQYHPHKSTKLNCNLTRTLGKHHFGLIIQLQHNHTLSHEINRVRNTANALEVWNMGVLLTNIITAEHLIWPPHRHPLQLSAAACKWQLWFSLRRQTGYPGSVTKILQQQEITSPNSNVERSIKMFYFRFFLVYFIRKQV